MYNVKISSKPDIYNFPFLEDIESGKKVRFEAEHVPGKGWTVVKITGSKRTGRTVERAQGFEGVESYTCHQAQLAAENHYRDVFRSASE